MRVAFIIPLAPKHYHYIYNLIDLMNTNNIKIDLYIVFSNNNEYNLFNKKDDIKSIIIPHTNTGNIVTYKQFFALEQLKNDDRYDYFIVCDSEITIIPENFTEENILNKINNIFENKIIYAGEDKNSRRITETSAKIISNKLQDITKNYNLYYWWSDLPVFKRDHLEDFFNKINYSNINWHHFEHIIYLNYLILYYDFKMVNLTKLINHNFSLESYNTNNKNHLKLLEENKYGFSFVVPKFYNNHKEFLNKQKCFLLYHLDRR